MKTKIALIALTTYLLFSPCEAMMRRLATSVPKIVQALPQSPCMSFHQSPILCDLPDFEMPEFDEDFGGFRTNEEREEFLGKDNLSLLEACFGKTEKDAFLALTNYFIEKHRYSLCDRVENAVCSKDNLKSMLKINPHKIRKFELLCIIEDPDNFLPDGAVPEGLTKEEMVEVAKRIYYSYCSKEEIMIKWVLEEQYKLQEKVDTLSETLLQIQEKDAD